MKKANQLTWVLIAALGTGSLTYSCNEKKEHLTGEQQAMQEDQDSRDRVKEMQDNIRQEKEEFIVQARAKIEKNENDIEDLKMVAKTKAGDAKTRYEQGIENLKAENERLKASIDANKETVNDKWDNFKVEFNHDMDKLGTAISDLFQDNK